MSNIILSVLITSHNNEKEISRCLDSILMQKLKVPFEIIISDDNSTDNTWNIICNYKSNYSGIIRSYKINSNDYNPDITSDRCAINKAHVYSQSKGKYIVNIDADDYLCINTIYQEQIDILESHPKCYICLQNIVLQDNGDESNFSKLWFPKGFLNIEGVVDAKTFFEKGLLISNPAIMMRRDYKLNASKKYGLFFDDFVITLHHLTLGNVLCLDKAGYVYVQYKNSIWNSVINSSYACVRSMAAINILLNYFPQFRYNILYSNIITYINGLKDLSKRNELLKIEVANLKYINRINSKFLNNIVNNKSLFRQNIYVRFYLILFLLGSKFKVLIKFLYYIIR